MSIETMTKLATVTVGSGGSSSIDFTNIPQTYTDLVVKLSIRSTRSGTTFTQLGIRLNGLTTGYSQRYLNGDGSAAGSGADTTQYFGYGSMAIDSANSTSNTFSSIDIYIANYTSSNFKSASIDHVAENNATAGNVQIGAALLSNTAAITSISINEPNSNSNFAQHTTFTLYGIKNARKTAGNSIKATGGNISFDGTYVVHTFTSSGTFTPTVGLVADYLVVAGGGGGGGELSSNAGAGGGGAGGYRTSIGGTALSLTAQNYTVTVGGGGAGGIAGNTSASNGIAGSNSVFSTITSTGGGFGTPRNITGGSGGSGGGAGLSGTGGAGNTPSTSPSQGNNGGNGSGSAGGGGGGASAVGVNAPANQTGGNGGAGSANSISGSSVTYAGGGGGGGTTIGTGGAGGGGNGGNNSAGVAATANTGGGGGGAYDQSSSGRAGGAGGSGIVIIRYKA